MLSFIRPSVNRKIFSRSVQTSIAGWLSLYRTWLLGWKDWRARTSDHAWHDALHWNFIQGTYNAKVQWKQIFRLALCQCASSHYDVLAWKQFSLDPRRLISYWQYFCKNVSQETSITHWLSDRQNPLAQKPARPRLSCRAFFAHWEIVVECAMFNSHGRRAEDVHVEWRRLQIY